MTRLLDPLSTGLYVMRKGLPVELKERDGELLLPFRKRGTLQYFTYNPALDGEYMTKEVVRTSYPEGLLCEENKCLEF